MSSARIPPELARRIDRLARAAHAFHRFAHHPLCGEYAGETIRVGRRTRVCRGCALAAVGALAGAALGLALAPGALVAAAALVPVAPLAAWRTRRGTKIPTRLVPAALAAFALGAALHLAAPAAGAITLAGLACLAVLFVSYRRRRPDRTPCASCPERPGDRPCRGFAEIVRRERGVQRLAGRWLSSSTARSRAGATSAPPTLLQSCRGIQPRRASGTGRSLLRSRSSTVTST
jgi:hypothetical protein